MLSNDLYVQAAEFFDLAIRHFAGLERAKDITLLDFGCGTGLLVREFLKRGYEAYGCDFDHSLPRAGENNSLASRLRPISTSPYRLPFPDDSLDVVVSTSVLEHIYEKRKAFEEIHRVLKPGGVAMHVFPSKWYLPCEPHLHVPLANVLWPKIPTLWFSLWALLGVRNTFQYGLSWRETRDRNVAYAHNGVSYWPLRAYRRLSLEVFGSFECPMRFFLEHQRGGSAALYRLFPAKSIMATILGAVRNTFIVQFKKR